jgi:hypothetical protein
MENSLKFALSQTKNPKEQTKVRELLSLVNAQKMDLESRKSPGTMH